jgi:hypothetical protein
MEVLMIKAYPKIFTIGQKYIQDIFDNPVIIEEKIDGSQMSFGKINGEFYCRSKGKIQIPEVADKLFKPAIEYCQSIFEELPDDIVFYGETLSKPKHNTLAYDRTPKNFIILFGACDIHGNFIKDYRKYCELLDLESVPIIFEGKINNADELKSLLDKVSVLGGQKIEGVVVKDYSREVMVGGKIVPLMAGKFVSEAFKEVHNKNWKRDNTNKGKWEIFKEKYRSEARWNKAIQHLREEGQLKRSPKDIGKIMAEVNRDITEECREEIKAFLWKEFGKEILRHATKGIPEWYKDKLLKGSFNG